MNLARHRGAFRCKWPKLSVFIARKKILPVKCKVDVKKRAKNKSSAKSSRTAFICSKRRRGKNNRDRAVFA
jgi:hypothetical protein